MITFKELIKNIQLNDIPIAHQQNLQDLLVKINVIRKAYGKPMTVSSGFRSISDHLRIYSEKGITDKSKIPMKSKHLEGKACDIADPNQELQKWCLENIALLEEAGLWLESFDYCKNWVHFQSVPYGSWKPGKSRFFIP